MTKRRQMGTGSIFPGSDGAWHVAVMLQGHRRVRRRRWTEADAEAVLAELLVKHADELGYYYHARTSGIRRPELIGIESHYTRRRNITVKDRFAVFDRDGFRCVYCGATADDARLAVDHVQPLADGGTDDLSNLATACVPCNLGKAGRSLLSLPSTLAARVKIPD